jgi:hypothetical protein
VLVRSPYSAYYSQIGMSVVLGPVHAFLARLAALVRDGSAADRHFRSALARAELLAARPAVARIRCHYGEFLLSSGSRSARPAALDLLRQSRKTARELGMAGIVARADQTLTGLQADPGVPTSASRC